MYTNSQNYRHLFLFNLWFGNLGILEEYCKIIVVNVNFFNCNYFISIIHVKYIFSISDYFLIKLISIISSWNFVVKVSSFTLIPFSFYKTGNNYQKVFFEDIFLWLQLIFYYVLVKIPYKCFIKNFLLPRNIALVFKSYNINLFFLNMIANLPRKLGLEMDIFYTSLIVEVNYQQKRA